MTLAGLVARNHSVAGFLPTEIYTVAGQAQGGPLFTAYSTVRVQTVVGPTNDSWLAGNFDGSNGWYFARAATPGVEFIFHVDTEEIRIAVEPATALDRTFFLGITSDGTNFTAWIDGVAVGIVLLTAVAGTGDLEVGGSVANPAFDPCPDSIVIVGYTSAAALTATQFQIEFTTQRRYGRPLNITPYFYNARNLYAQDGVVAAPATWTNIGSAGAAGNLTWTGVGNLLFEEDPSPAFPGRVPPSDILLTPRDLYVATTGNDANNGLTPATPVLTLAGAYSKIPPILENSVVIHVAAGTFEWTSVPNFLSVTDSAQIIVWGDGAGQPGEDGDNVIASFTMDAGTTGTDIVATTPSAVDAYLGFSFRITSGAADTSRRTIRNNDVNDFIPADSINPAPSPGDTFDVFLPATTFMLTATYYYDNPICLGPDNVTLINAGLDSGGFATFVSDNTLVTKMFGCVVYSGAVFASRCLTAIGVTSPPNSESWRLGALWTVIGNQAGTWSGWGLGAPDGSAVYYDSLSDTTAFIVSAASMDITSDSTSTTNFRWAGGGVQQLFVDGGFVNIDGLTFPGGVPVRIFNRTPAVNAGFLINLDNDARLRMNERCVDIDGSTSLANGGAIGSSDSFVEFIPQNNNNVVTLDGGLGIGVLLENSKMSSYVYSTITIDGDVGGLVLRSMSEFLCRSINVLGALNITSSANPACTLIDGSKIVCTNDNPAGSGMDIVVTGDEVGILAQGASSFIFSHGNGSLTVTGQVGVLCRENSAVYCITIDVTSSAGAGIRALSGGKVSIGDGTTVINATGNGVDVTGGGQCNFQAGGGGNVSIAATGAELVVGPNVVTEQTTYALGLPAAGASFANTGKGSAINRNT